MWHSALPKYNKTCAAFLSSRLKLGGVGESEVKERQINLRNHSSAP